MIRYLSRKVSDYVAKFKCKNSEEEKKDAKTENEFYEEVGTLKTEKCQELDPETILDNKNTFDNFEDDFELTNDIEDLVANAENLKEKMENGDYDAVTEAYLKTRLKEKSDLIKAAFGDDYSDLTDLFDNIARYSGLDKNLLESSKEFTSEGDSSSSGSSWFNRPHNPHDIPRYESAMKGQLSPKRKKISSYSNQKTNDLNTESLENRL